MATAKKATTNSKSTAKAAKSKSTAVSKKTHAKQASVKATPKTKAQVSKKSHSASVKSKSKAKADCMAMRSFRVAPESKPFLSFSLTRQTLYWIILVAFIVFTQLWIINLQVEVASLIDAQQAQIDESF